MALNPRYVTAPSLQSYFVDKDSGLPLSGGKVFYYRDSNRTELKSVYELQGNQANYTYAPLPNPVILSAVGTIQDNNGNDVIPYYYPFDEFGDADLYFIVVQNSLGVPQFTRQAWPNPNFNDAPSSSDELFNYIPNGQLLAHTDLPNNELVAGTNVIAQGGFSVELEDPLLSTNTLEFEVEQFTQAPPQSPRYLMTFTCSSFYTTETIKNIRIKWTDVNKFSTKPGMYTFAFWATSNVNLPVSIDVVKFFGTNGSPGFSTTQALATITPATDQTLYQFQIDFGFNNSYEIDDVLQDDFIAIDISLPRNLAFVASFTDFVLVAGDTQVLNFPVQTDADMMARGVFGWADKIDPTGAYLYLPPILTKEGMTWDTTQIATIGWDVFPIDDPSSLIPPPPKHNKMPCDGATYIYSEYAANGIPFSRLGSQLISRNPSNSSLPLYGTGTNFVSALVPFSGANNDTFRITYNLAGTGSTLAAEGAIATGFTFDPIYIYGGSSTGHASFNILASNTGTSNRLLVVNDFFDEDTNLSMANGPISAGFTFTAQQGNTALLAFQRGAYFVDTVSGAALVVVGDGRNFTFQITGSVPGPLYRVWFNVNGLNTAPPAGGATLIEVNITSSYSAADVADVVREVLNAFQSTNITVPGLPPAGSYFTFSANPASLRNFYVWFTVDGTGADPEPPGYIGIQVNLVSTNTPTNIRDAIRAAINRYQFQAPDFTGMFFRGADPNSTWDFDAINRWSYTTGVGGAMAGTFEFSQFLAHYHTLGNQLQSPGGTIDANAGYDLINDTTGTSGGSETRPVNTYLYPFIRY